MKCDSPSQQLLGDLEQYRDELCDIIRDESGYDATDFSFLWQDMQDYLTKFETVLSSAEAARRELNLGAARACENSALKWFPWGRILFCPASNAVIPVVPTTLFTLLSAENTVVFAPSRKTLKSCRLIFDILTHRFHWHDRILLFEGGGRKAIDEFVKAQKVALLWFQGDSKHRQSVIRDCLDFGVDYVFEGSGNCVTIVDTGASPGSLMTAAESIYRALQVCRGMLCTTPRIVFIKAGLLSSFKSHIGDLMGKTAFTTQINIAEYSLESVPNAILSTESFDNCLKLVAFNSLAEVKETLQHYRFGIQLAFFSQDAPENLIRALGNINVSRLLFNTSPVFQRTAVAWGGYGISGPNPLATLVEKSQRAVLIHGYSAQHGASLQGGSVGRWRCGTGEQGTSQLS